jgi:hypothetical protein
LIQIPLAFWPTTAGNPPWNPHMARLLIQRKDGTSMAHDLNDGATSIGRHPECAIVLEDDSVSSRHAEIIAADGCHTLRDLRSTNGTQVNGKRTSETTIKAGDIISFGAVECFLEDHATAGMPRSTRPGFAPQEQRSRIPPPVASSVDAILLITCKVCGQKNRIRILTSNGANRCGACRSPLLITPGERVLAFLRVHRLKKISRGLATVLAFAAFATVIGVTCSALMKRGNSIPHSPPSLIFPDLGNNHETLNNADVFLASLRTAMQTPAQNVPTTGSLVPEPAGVVALTNGLTFAPGTPAPSLEPELPLPENGEIRTYTSDTPLAPFEIKSSAEANYLVKLVDAGNGKGVMTIFVRGGNTVNVKVPLGVYEVKYAAGDKWHGYGSLFGPFTSYSKATTTFFFRQEERQVTGYSITLYKVLNGNLRTEPINASQF